MRVWSFVVVCVVAGCAGTPNGGSGSAVVPERPFTEGEAKVMLEKDVPRAEGPKVASSTGGGPTEPVLDPESASILEEYRKSWQQQVEKPLERLIAGLKRPSLTEEQKKRRDGLLLRARELMLQKRYGDAQRLLDEALRMDPLNEEANKLWTQCAKNVRRNIEIPPIRAPKIEVTPHQPSHPAPPPSPEADPFETLWKEAERLRAAGKVKDAKTLYQALMDHALWSKDPRAPEYYRRARKRLVELGGLGGDGKK